MGSFLSVVGAFLGLGFLTGCTIIGMIGVCKGLIKGIMSIFR